MQVHKIISFVAGDDWQINIALRDQDDKPYNIDELTEIKFLLHNPRGEIVPIDHVMQTIDSAAGKIKVWFPSSETTNLAGGVYADFLRIICGGITSTLLMGNISVIADPWKAKVAAAPVVGRSSADVIVLLDRRERIRREAVAEALPLTGT